MKFAENWVTAGWSRGPGGEWIELGAVAGIRSDPQPAKPEIGVHDIAVILNALERSGAAAGHLAPPEPRGTTVTFENGQPHIHAHPTVCANCRCFPPTGDINVSECAVWYRQDLITGQKQHHGPLCRDKNRGNCADFVPRGSPTSGA